MTLPHGKSGHCATGAPERQIGTLGGPTRKMLAGGLLIILALLVLFLPSPYTIETPGPTQDVLGSSKGSPVIKVKGGQVHHDKGRLLMTTVNARGIPGYPASNLDALVGWADPHATVLPQEAVVPPGQSVEEYRRQEQGDMHGSQKAASAQALAFLKARGYDVSGLQFSMRVADIGGPSAGLMYTLGAIDKITPEQETGGLTIAGTGTMDQKGRVGAIGGIQLKMLGARRDGATWFLAPAANCSQVTGHVPQGLRDVRVSTLDEAYKALVAIGHGQGEGLPRCTATKGR